MRLMCWLQHSTAQLRAHAGSRTCAPSRQLPQQSRAEQRMLPQQSRAEQQSRAQLSSAQQRHVRLQAAHLHRLADAAPEAVLLGKAGGQETQDAALPAAHQLAAPACMVVGRLRLCVTLLRSCRHSARNRPSAINQTAGAVPFTLGPAPCAIHPYHAHVCIHVLSGRQLARKTDTATTRII